MRPAAAAAAVRMRRGPREIGRFRTSAGLVRLRMSVGVHSGDVRFFLAGGSHRELIVSGPAVTRTVEMESAAGAGQILVSDSTAAAIPPSSAGEARDGGRLLKKAPTAGAGRVAAPPQQEYDRPEVFIPTAIREHLLGTAVATSALGRAATRAGRIDEARALLEEALDSFRDMGAESFVAETEARLAELRLFAGDETAALGLIASTLARSDVGGMVSVKAMLYRLRGYALMRRGEWDAARAAIEESLRMARSISAQYEVALSLQACASLANATSGDPAPYLDECVPILERLGVISMSRLERAWSPEAATAG